MKSDIGAIAYALAEGVKLWRQWLISAERRRLRKALNIAERYMDTTEKLFNFLNKKEKEKVIKKLNSLKHAFNRLD